MNKISKTIPKHPDLKPSEDYYRLRKDGIGFIEQMGSQLWTDYNTHDPGITILEALCYALTDLAYRVGWDIKDILTPPTPASEPGGPFPDQPFFTAKKILTVNPWTIDDFRRMLIDLEMVRNAWVFCKECVCEASYYAWCEKDQLKLSYQKPDPKLHPNPKTVEPYGLYDVLLELESDPELDDLNDRKIEHTLVITGAGNARHYILMELRFPETDLTSIGFAEFANASLIVKLTRLGAKKNFDVFTNPGLPEAVDRDNYLHRHWKDVFYLDFDITHDSTTFTIKNVAMRLFSDTAAKAAMTAEEMKGQFNNNNVGSAVIQRYCKKRKKARDVIVGAKKVLQAHRNLDEDYCCIKIVGTEDVAVCADVELKSDADIEWVQARIWFEIEQYFNPPVPFYTLQELMESGVPVDEIFNGYELNNGFIKVTELEAAGLRTVLRTSDIINRLMDIEGVVTVNQLQLVKYDAEGNIIGGAADPVLGSDGSAIFDVNKTAASWLLYPGKQCRPRLYQNASSFLFYKNGLPFRPRMDEVRDTLIRLRGKAERPKITDTPNDLPVPAGRYRDPEDYYPVQYTFPLNYGIGQEGLPLHASAGRQAQAKQLKAYLMVFEQILGNAFAQIAHTADLFSLEKEIKNTYFIQEFSNAIIQGYDEITKEVLDQSTLKTIVETESEFQERRNRFLDHIMARFGEQFTEYTLLLTNLEGRQVALAQLINDKLSLLSKYPEISHDRAKAFNYTLLPYLLDYQYLQYLRDIQSGIKTRISRLLGYPDIEIVWLPVTDLGIDKFRLKFQITCLGRALAGHITLSAGSEGEAKVLGRRAVIKRMSYAANYKVAGKVIANGPDKFVLRLKGNATEGHGRCPEPFDTEDAAESLRDKLVAWSANERVIVVEHLLLRPRFPGDALYPACPDGTCATCGDEDPYSFRLTFVMPGWPAPFDRNLQVRDFADRTIRQETPSHLIGKICWVGNDEYRFDRFEDAWYKWLEANVEFDWTEERLRQSVEAILEDNEEFSREALCGYSSGILSNYGVAFYQWMDGNFKAGKTLEEFKQYDDFPVPEMPSGVDFKTNTAVQISNLLVQRYKQYIEVSYRLRVVVDLLSKLTSIYPPSTLHDWEEGNDENPVRLGKTALGS